MEPPAPALRPDESLETITARVNFYEASVEQIKREFPRYLLHLADTERSHSALSKVLKSVASSEPNTVLQYIMFLYAQKEEMLAKEQVLYKQRGGDVREMLDNWSKMIIQPMRDVIADHNFQVKTHAPLPLQPAHPAGPALSSAAPNPTSGALHGPDHTNPPGAPAAPQVESPVTRERKAPELVASLKTMLPVHAKLFEKHRLREMKRLLHSMLLSEVQYHAKALEAYGQLLECICDADERDSSLPI